MDYTHMDILTEILFEAELFDEVDNVLAREGTVLEDGKFLRLDLSNLGISELPEVINGLKGIDVLDLRFNNIRDFPREILELNESEILLDGNPSDTIDKGIVEEGSARTRKVDVGKVYYPEKQCNWCGRSAGYRKEEGKLDGVWGGTVHYLKFLICNSCNHVEPFYGTRFLF